MEFPVVTNMGAHFNGYGAAGTEGATITGNVCEGGTAGFYAEVFWETNLTVSGNIFRHVWNGVIIAKSAGFGWQNVSVLNNSIELSADVPAEEYGYTYGICVVNADTNVLDRNLLVACNTVAVYGGGKAARGTRGVEVRGSTVTNVACVKILDNVITRDMTFTVHAKNAAVTGNTDADGVPFLLSAVPVPIVPLTNFIGLTNRGL